MAETKSSDTFDHYVIALGASMGGIKAVSAVVQSLPPDLPAALFVVIHTHPNSPSMLDRMIGGRTRLKTRFARHGARIETGTIYIAPPDHHLLVTGDRMILSHGPRENRFRPAIDTLFRSVGVAHGPRAIGIVLSGLLDDGTAGLQAIKQCGGRTLVQDPEEAAFSEMPMNALQQVAIDHVATLSAMPPLIGRMVQDAQPLPMAVPEHLRLEVLLSSNQIHPPLSQRILGPLTPIVCPDCGGALSELNEERLTRFRCHEGHAFGPQSLIAAQNERIEYSLWAAVRALEEQVGVLRKLSERNGLTDRTGYEQRACELHAHAERIKTFLYQNIHPPL